MDKNRAIFRTSIKSLFLVGIFSFIDIFLLVSLGQHGVRLNEIEWTNNVVYLVATNRQSPFHCFGNVCVCVCLSGVYLFILARWRT